MNIINNIDTPETEIQILVIFFSNFFILLIQILLTSKNLKSVYMDKLITEM